MIQLFTKITRNFVNIPINSKFYHSPLPTKLPDVLQLLKNQSKKNEKIVLLQHIVDLFEADPKLNLSVPYKAIITNQINQWKTENRGFNQGLKRSQKVASIAWIIKKLGLLKYHKDLYQQIVQRVVDDEWYVNFDQSVKAMQAFADLQNEAVRNQIYEKIQRNVGITIWQVNMTYYKRLATSLLEAKRFDSVLWDKLQQHVISNLGMSYSTRTFCDIFRAFALSKNGSEDFFLAFQYVIMRGHLWKQHFLSQNQLHFDTSGEFFALIVKTYGIIRKNTDIQFLQDFKQYVYDSLIDRKTVYKSLSSFTQIVRHLPYLGFQKQQQDQIFMRILSNKRPTQIESIQDIKQFYIAVFTLDQRYKKVLQNFSLSVQDIIVREIENKFIPSVQIVQIINFLLERNCIIKQGRVIEAFNNYIQQNFKYIPGSQARQLLGLIRQVPKIGQKTAAKLLLPGSNQIKKGPKIDHLL